MSRLTRKDMKRDEVADTARSVVSYLQDNVRTILVVVAALVVLAIAAAIWAGVRARANDRVNEQLAQALLVFNAPIDADAPKPDDAESPSFATEAERNARSKVLFEQILDSSGGQGLGTVALAHLGDLAAAEGDLVAAEERWREALHEGAGSLLAGRLHLNLVNLLRGRGDGEAAEEELRSLLRTGAAVPTDVILFELAKTLESLERPDEARATYQRLVDEYPGSAFFSDATQKLGEL